jgi:hypothetical protein
MDCGARPNGRRGSSHRAPQYRPARRSVSACDLQAARFGKAEIAVRFKIISGTFQSAGIAVCLRSPASYYAVSASALEHRVDLLLVMNGKIERIDTADAEVTLDRWHTLGVTVNDDHFVVSLDKKVLFTTFDRTRMKDGHIALWTQEDNVTRFDQIQIRSLPSSEVR